MPAQVLDDLMLVYQNKRALPAACVFVLREKGNVRVADHIEVTSPDGSTSFRFNWRVIEAWTVSADELLATGDPGLVPWATLGRTALPAEPFLTECRRVVEERAPKEDVEPLLTVTGILARLRYDREVIDAIFLGSKGMLGIESPLIDEWREEGEIRGMRKMLLRVLRARFGALPADLEARVWAITEIGVLDSLAEASGASANLDPFLQHLPPA